MSLSKTKCLIDPSVTSNVTAAVMRDKNRRPIFAETLGDAMNILTEEYLGLATAYNDHKHVAPHLFQVRAEALDVAAVIIRLLEYINESLTAEDEESWMS